MDNPGYEKTEEVPTSVSRSRSTASTLPLQTYSHQSYTEEKSHHTRIELKRTVGLFSACCFIVGTVIGSGIFVTPKGVLDGAGSAGLTLIIWVLCGFFSLMGALAYAELGTVVPESGGSFFYFLEALAPDRKHKKSSWWREVIPFLYQWQNIIFLKPASLAVQGLTSGTYFVKLAGIGCDASFVLENEEIVIKLIAVCIIFVVCFINCTSIKAATRIQNIFSTAKVLALILIIIGGLFQLINGSKGVLGTGFQRTNYSYSGLSQAFYSSLWAYAGWDNLNYITNEIKNPARNLPRALIFSISLITVIYTCTNVAYFSVLNREEISASAAVAESFGMKLLGAGGAVIMVLSVASSTTGSANGGLFTSGRLVYCAGQEGHMVDFLSFIHIKRFTPSPAIIFTTLMALLYVALDIFSLISLTGFVEWIFMGLCMGTLLRFRWTKKDREDTVTVPILVPVIVVLFSIFLTITPFIDNAKIEYIFVLLMELVGVLFYTVFVYFQLRIPFIGTLRETVQKLLTVVPVD